MEKKKEKKKVKMQNSPSIFYQNSFWSSNFAFVYFNHLTFKFIQLTFFHQILLYVMVNFPIFKNIYSKFLN